MLGPKAWLRPRRALTLVLTVTLGLSVAACGSDSGGGGGGNSAKAASGGSYKIGFNDDLSGPIAFAGTAMQAGFMTYIDYVNKEQGGVNGKQIEVKAVDNRADGAVALSNYRDLVRSFKALATVGYSSSVAWSAAGAAADQTGVSQISISGVDKWTVEPHPYLFKVGQTQDAAMQVQAQYMKELAGQPGGTPTVGIFTITSASGPIFEAAAKKAAAANGWKVVNKQAVDPGASSCSAQAASMAAAKPTMIVSNLESAGEDVVCFKAMKSRGFSRPFINSFYSASEKTFETLASPQWNAERVFVWPTDATVPAAKDMFDRATKYGHANKIGDFFSDGYLAAMLVANALQKCGAGCTAKSFRDALEGISSLDTGGLAGPHFGFASGPNGHMAAPDGKIYKWDASKKQSVETSDWICGLPARC
jgi:branched-chain amino acid transport system substrate-binding protein